MVKIDELIHDVYGHQSIFMGFHVRNHGEIP